MSDSKKYKIIIWDWHKVLGMRGFWHRSVETDPAIGKAVGYLFGPGVDIDDWMRDTTNLDQLLPQSGLSVDKQQLLDALKADWGDAEIVNLALLSAIRQLYPTADHYIVTDNMDIFADYAKQNHYLA